MSSAYSFCEDSGSWRFLCLLSAILLSLQTANKDGAGGGFAGEEDYSVSWYGNTDIIIFQQDNNFLAFTTDLQSSQTE